MTDKALSGNLVEDKLSDLSGLIAYLEATSEEEWLIGKVRSKDSSQNCMMGHMCNFVYGKDFKGNMVDAWDFFEAIWATEFMIYPVNDGKDSRYQQSTPKQRVIAYLKDIAGGVRKNTRQLMDDEIEIRKSAKAI